MLAHNVDVMEYFSAVQGLTRLMLGESEPTVDDFRAVLPSMDMPVDRVVSERKRPRVSESKTRLEPPDVSGDISAFILERQSRK